MPENQRLLNEKEVADYLGKKISALQKWRWAGRGPVFVKVGRLVRYRMSDIESWLATNTIIPRHEAQA